MVTSNYIWSRAKALSFRKCGSSETADPYKVKLNIFMSVASLRVKGETLVVRGVRIVGLHFLVFVTLVFQLAKPRLKDFE